MNFHHLYHLSKKTSGVSRKFRFKSAREVKFSVVKTDVIELSVFGSTREIGDWLSDFVEEKD
jgi:hypothetical protein